MMRNRIRVLPSAPTNARWVSGVGTVGKWRARFPWRPTPVNPLGVTGTRCVPPRGVWARSDRDGIDWGRRASNVKS